ncbi:uncharacterized protein PFLUO_LOCUS7538 [Penicillium psychrofluorescens]|uniref:uncharacterized protein n=1 Tax=Penicillium psychrofluorescens TaxID=3158075 RepID=UPI003CCDB42B
MNPTVEDDRHEPPGTSGSSNRTPIAWAELFSRHETMLTSHLELLDSVKEHMARDGNAFRTVSSMVQKTVQAMNQFALVRKKMSNHKTALDEDHSTATSHTSSMNGASRSHTHTPTPYSTDSVNTARRKRSRNEKEGEKERGPDFGTPPTDQNQAYEDTDARAPKRKRSSYSAVPGADDDLRDATEASVETEDISAEVQRRLRIKEERRRKRERDDARPEKRKRTSGASNGSVSPDRSRPKRKRSKVEVAADVDAGSDLKRGAESVSEGETVGSSKKRRLILPELQDQNMEAAAECLELPDAAHQDNMDAERELRELFRGIERGLKEGTQAESGSLSSSFDGRTDASHTTGMSYGLAPTNTLMESELTWEIETGFYHLHQGRYYIDGSQFEVSAQDEDEGMGIIQRDIMQREIIRRIDRALVEANILLNEIEASRRSLEAVQEHSIPAVMADQHLISSESGAQPTLDPLPVEFSLSDEAAIASVDIASVDGEVICDGRDSLVEQDFDFGEGC